MKRTLIIAFLSAGVFLLFLAPNVQAQQSKKITLAGYKHKPPVQTSGSGMATVTLHNDTLTVKGKFKDLNGNFSGGYLMVSLRGQGGNQLYRLNATLNEDDKTSGQFVAKDNKFALSPAEIKLLKKGNLYINISSFENQKGELRGDIGPMGK